MESFYESCHQVYLQLLRALAIGMGLCPTFFQKLCRQNSSELRINHYPSCNPNALPPDAKRISEHTDFGTVTLLFQDSVGGLEIEDQANLGNYVPVSSDANSEIIVNIGDCLQRWTNDMFHSTSHRVVVSGEGGNWAEDRYSVGYFGKPDWDQSVGCLREFLPEGTKPKYENITAWEYNQEKLSLVY